MDSNERACRSRGKSRTMTTAGKSSVNTGRKSRATTTSPRSTGAGSPESMWSAAGSPANLSVVPGSVEAIRMTAISGQKLFDVSKHSGPLGSLVRMCLASSLWHSTRCVLIWKHSTTPSGRSVYRLVPSMRRISVNDSGLWPTPNARDHKDVGVNVDWKKVAKKSRLAGRVMLATPRSNDYRGPCYSGSRQALSMLPTQIGGALNPAWVEWLMGFPIGWTDLGDSATPLSRRSSKRSVE